MRQVADVLVDELGEPFIEMWRGLVEDHGEKEAARHLAKIVGAIDDFGLDEVRKSFVDGKLKPLTKPRPPQLSAVVPEVLRVDVQRPDFAAYDELLQRGAA